jgi:signal transduction histidine kinase
LKVFTRLSGNKPQIRRNRLRPTIVKKLIKILGGQITLTSTVGQGSKFSFELEFKVNENQATVEKKQKFTTNLF